MVQLHRQWNSGLVACSGRSFWPQLSGKMTHQFQQFLFIRTWTSRASPNTFIVRQCRVRRALQGHQQGGVLQPRVQCLSHLGPIWASHMCLQQEQHRDNSQQRHQQEQHQRGERETFKGQIRWQLIQTWTRSLSSTEPSSCDDHIQQVDSESKHCKKGPILFFFQGAQESWRKLSPGMDMCWVPPSRRFCADSVRACLHGSTVWQSRKYFPGCLKFI